MLVLAWPCHPLWAGRHVEWCPGPVLNACHAGLQAGVGQAQACAPAIQGQVGDSHTVGPSWETLQHLAGDREQIVTPYQLQPG